MDKIEKAINEIKKHTEYNDIIPLPTEDECHFSLKIADHENNNFIVKCEKVELWNGPGTTNKYIIDLHFPEEILWDKCIKKDVKIIK